MTDAPDLDPNDALDPGLIDKSARTAPQVDEAADGPANLIAAEPVDDEWGAEA